MWTNHSFYKYHWCHVIDTVIQFCTIVGLVNKLRSMSVRSWRWTSRRLPRNPRMAARVLLKRANLSLDLMYVMTDAYGPLRFSAIFSASLLFTLLHSGAIPPLVKTRGLNEDLYMSITLWLYLSFFSFSCCWYTSARDFPEYDCEEGCVILMSKKVFSQLFHSPLAEISNLALSAVLTLLP